MLGQTTQLTVNEEYWMKSTGTLKMAKAESVLGVKVVTCASMDVPCDEVACLNELDSQFDKAGTRMLLQLVRSYASHSAIKPFIGL